MILGSIVLIPAFLATWIAFGKKPERAFLDVYLPVLLLLPGYFRWVLPGLPDPGFDTATLAPIAAAALVRGIRWRTSIADLFVLGFACAVVYSEYSNNGYSEAQNLFVDTVSQVVLPYFLAKALVEPLGLRIPFARRIVFLIFVVSVTAVWEFKMGYSVYRRYLDKFFPGQGDGWVTTFRWGFARIAGPYAHAILAGVVIMVGLYLALWLHWSGAWEKRFRWPPGVDADKGKLIVWGIAAGSLMTMCRGPWIAGGVAAIFAFIGRSRDRKKTGGIFLALALVVGLPAYLAFKAYVSVGREGAKTQAQETAAYRKELMDKYTAIVMEKAAFGWGRSTWPKVPGMPSIDNHYLLLSLMHGLVASGLLLSTFLVMVVRLYLRGLRSPPGAGPRGSNLAFALVAIYVTFLISHATVFMGLQTISLFFLITGWAEGYLLFGRETASEAPPAFALAGPFRFPRVLSGPSASR